jgi:hypothetical protein
VRKLPLVSQDAAPIQARLMSEYFERVGKRIRMELESLDEKPPIEHDSEPLRIAPEQLR